MVPSKVALAPERMREKTGKISEGIKGYLLGEGIARLEAFRRRMLRGTHQTGLLRVFAELPVKIGFRQSNYGYRLLCLLDFFSFQFYSETSLLLRGFLDRICQGGYSHAVPYEEGFCLVNSNQV